MSHTPTPPADLAGARATYEKRRWADASERLAAADATSPLEAEDLERWADATWWLGSLSRTIEIRQRAFAAFKAAGDRVGAARTALQLETHHSNRLESSIAAGWHSRAERLLDGTDEAPEHASLGRARLHGTLARGDLDESLRIAEANLELGIRLANQDVEAVALQDRARVLLAMGRVEEGLSNLNEAVVAAVAGELSPFAAGIVYCNATIACEDLTDYRRAGEFADAASRWCESEDITGFPGLCRVRRVEIIRLKGDLATAQREARKACEELSDFSPAYAGEGYYQMGEIHLRLSEHQAAEASFAEAHRLGRQPLPGLAMLRLAQGDTDGCTTLLARAMAAPGVTALERARLLPAEAAVALAVSDLPRARVAASELEEIAATFKTHLLVAQAQQARAGVSLLEGALDDAIGSLGAAVRSWKDTDAPWEMAHARLLQGEAYLAAGETIAAGLELSAAKAAFEELGTDADGERAQRLLDGNIAPRFEPTTTTRVGRTFMFTDIVRSTNLIEAVGDEAWNTLLGWHDNMIRGVVSEHRGEEVDHAGDGFFVAFESADDALDCALAIRDGLMEHRDETGFAPEVRFGLHSAEALQTSEGYAGGGVHAAARVGSLAVGGEIVVSRSTIEAAARMPAHGPWQVRNLKGLAEPIEITSLD